MAADANRAPPIPVRAAPSVSRARLAPRIPTSDPQAALRFCRSLAAELDAVGDASRFAAPAVTVTPAAVASTPVACPDVSVVVPVYNEIDSLPVLFERLCAVLEQQGVTFEVVLVDDGSTDGSKSFVTDLALRDPCVVAVDLARNFGHQVAISAGLEHSTGRAVVVMDADLQDPPEVVPRLLEKWRAGYDVAYAVRTRRKEPWLKRCAYSVFYRLLKRIAAIDIPLDAGDFCVMDRRVVDVLNGMPERSRFVRGIRSWVGFNQASVPYERQSRHAGDSKYTFARLLYLALDGIVSFSYLPLRVITALGFCASAFALVLAAFYAVKKLTIGLNPPGFATLAVAIFLMTGIQLITIGVIGEYVGRIFEEVKRRPLYVVDRVTRLPRP